MGNTLGVSKLSSDWLNSTGFLEDVGCLRSLTGHLKTKRWIFKSMCRSVHHCCSKLARHSPINNLLDARQTFFVGTQISCFTCWPDVLLGSPWPMKAAMESRPSAVRLVHEKFLQCSFPLTGCHQLKRTVLSL